MAHSSDSSCLFEDSDVYSASEKEIEAMNSTAHEIVNFIRSIGVTSGDDLFLTVLASVSPSTMFDKSTPPFLFLWTELRKFLVLGKVAVKVYQLHSIICTVANAIFSKPKENKTALYLCNRIHSEMIFQNSIEISHKSGSHGASVKYQVYSKEKTAQIIAM